MVSYKHEEIAEDLRRRIAAGEWAVGTRLPGMNALARQYGAGNTVLQEAVAVLELSGLVVTRPGKAGTRVLAPDGGRRRLDLGKAVRRNDLGYLFSAPTGHWPPLREPSRQWQPCPGEVAEQLEVEPGSPVFARHRVVGPEGRAAQVTTTYFPDDVARGSVIEGADTGPGGWADRAEQDMGYGPLSWTTEITARLPSEDEARDLAISTRLPVLVTHRLHRSAQGKPVAVDVVVVDGRTFSYRVALSRGATARWPVSPATGRNTPR